MRKRSTFILPVLAYLISAPVFANWQYSNTYDGGGVYEDDGSRFVLSARGGASFGMGNIKNEIGAVFIEYYVVPGTGQVVPWGQCFVNGGCDGLDLAGYGNLSQLPATKDFETFSFAAGASLGWTLPNRPQWRIEAGWDHVEETDYNSSPMFSGDLELVDGLWPAAYIESGSVNSKVETDIISLMFFYDFFDGIEKPLGQFIPYVGFGIGYGDTKTVMNFYDPYGDISAQQEFAQYGEPDGYNLTQFYVSEYNTSNVVGMLSAGFSYGIADNAFLDIGGRAMLLPNIKWTLSNEDGSKHRDLFNATNVVYLNFTLGIRFEF